MLFAVRVILNTTAGSVRTPLPLKRLDIITVTTRHYAVKHYVYHGTYEPVCQF